MTQLNFVGNKYIFGPNANSLDCALGDIDEGYAQIYAVDNSTPWCENSGNCATATLSQMGFIGAERIGSPPLNEAAIRVGTPFSAPAVTTHASSSLETLLTSATTGAGATVPARDTLDARLISQMQSRSGVRGRQGDPWPVLAQGTPLLDNDHDGMPNDYEVAHGLNPSSAGDAAAISSNGYSNLENYINALAGDLVPPGSGDPIPLATPFNMRITVAP